MGLLKDVQNESGFTYLYHKIGSMSLTPGSGMFITMLSYKDKESRDAGRAPITTPLAFSGEEWAEAWKEIAPILYRLAKEKDPLLGAEDVIEVAEEPEVIA